MEQITSFVIFRRLTCHYDSIFHHVALVAVEAIFGISEISRDPRFLLLFCGIRYTEFFVELDKRNVGEVDDD